MIPPEDRIAALRQADFHVQVQLHNIPCNFEKGFGYLPVSGKIIKIFKASKDLQIGDAVEFDLPIAKREEGEFPIGWRMFWYEDLLKAKFLEVCLNGTPPKCETAIDLHEIIAGATNTPVIVIDSNEKFLPTPTRRWWKFGL